MTELWRDIPGWEGLYQASSEGCIRNARSGAIRKPQKHGGGYLTVVLHRGGQSKSATVNRWVALAFYGEPPDPTMHACHKDGDKLNNRASNVRWDTPSGNMLDKRKHGTDHEVSKTHCSLGHPLSMWNLIPRKWLDKGFRECRSCNNARSFIRYHELSDDCLADVAATYLWKFATTEYGVTCDHG